MGLLLACLPFAGLHAQEHALSARAPETGLAILDCAPAAPAPENSCLMRVPSGQRLGDLIAHDLGADEASFRVVRSSENLPNGLELSSTLILVDLSRGPNSGRLRSWQQERKAIVELISNLPNDGKMAIYGFGADLIEISGFSKGRASALDATNSLELTENNTILTSNISAAIDLLTEQEASLFKNLIVISDGDEEGIGDVDQINQSAADAGVTLSALGMFWRGEGNPATSRGIDVLGRVTAQQQGLKRSIFLGNEARSLEAAKRFARDFASSIGRSGLILPRGEPAPARITIEMRVPEPGQPDRYRTVEHQVKFTPVGGELPEIVEPEPLPQKLLFGYPAKYVFAAVGIFVLLLALLMFFAIRRGRTEEETSELGVETGDLPDETIFANEHEAQKPTPTPPAPPVAYLQRLDTGERLGLSGSRISIGRAGSNGIVIPDHGVSRIHAELVRNRDGGYLISDMGSLNGTFVNDNQISGTVTLRIGDVIGLGKTVNVKLVLP